MERLLTVDDVAAALRVCRRTAYTYMGQMIHLDKPRRVSEYSLREWIRERTAGPGEKSAGRRGSPAATNGKGKKKSPGKGLKMALVQDFKIPRRRA